MAVCHMGWIAVEDRVYTEFSSGHGALSAITRNDQIDTSRWSVQDRNSASITLGQIFHMIMSVSHCQKSQKDPKWQIQIQ